MAETKSTDGNLALEQKKYRVITIGATEKPQDLKLRVAAYARVSSASDDQLNSFAAQNKYYTSLISGKENWTMVDIYADEGITGTSIEKREDFKRMISDCRKGKIDRILVKSISRFARNTKECLETIRELKTLGISVYFEKENIDTAIVSGEMMTALFASFAQAESESISGNMRWSYQRRMRSGSYVPSKLPYGFIRVDRTIQSESFQAKVVKRIFDEYLNGISVEKIALRLRKDEVPCRAGSVAWDSTTIRYILTNEKYMGDSLWQKYYTTDTLPFRTIRNRGERESFYAMGTHEGIVTEDEFKRANALMKQRAKKIARVENVPYTLRKKIYCAECSSLFKRKEIRGVVYWVCIGHDKKRIPNCTMHPIRESAVYEAFCRLYYKLKTRGSSILESMLNNLQTIRSRRMLWSLDVIELNKRIGELTSQNQLLAALKQQGLVDPDIFISQTNALTKQLRSAKREKDRLLDTSSKVGRTSWQTLMRNCSVSLLIKS